MGDTSTVRDQIPAPLSPVAEDPGQQLRLTAYSAMGEGGSDRLRNQLPASSTRQFDNPYDHITAAGTAIRELEGLKGRGADETIQVTDAQGNIGQETVGALEQQLLQAIQAQFTAAVSAADRINQNGLNSRLMQLYAQEQQTTDPAQLANLKEQQTIFESMKHAPSVARFAYATFLADHGNFAAARPLLDEAARLDPEARSNQTFLRVYDMVNQQVRSQQSTITSENNPFAALQSADQKRQAGDAAGAEAEYKRALQLASQVDPQVVQQNLQRIDEAKQQNAGNQTVLTELNQQEQAWTAMAHATTLVRMDYADFLISQRRQPEAQQLLSQVTASDGAYVAGSPEFAQLQGKAGNASNAGEQTFDDPFQHLQKFQELYNKNDQQAARKELEAAMTAAGAINRDQMKSNIDAINEQLKVETDPQKKQNLQQMLQVYDSLYHADAFTKICMARYDLAQHNYNAAHALL